MNDHSPRRITEPQSTGADSVSPAGAAPADPFPAGSAPGLSRRDALKVGAAALAGGAVLLHPTLARAQASQPATDPAATAPGGEYARYLRDTRSDAWQEKVVPGSSLARRTQAIFRIDPLRPLPPGQPGRDYLPVITPDNFTLPFKIVDGVKVFHLIAEEVRHRFADGLEAYCWGYNGHVPGPTIEVVEGDRVRIYVTNRLPAPTTVHPHGFILPNGMDGVSGLTQPAILPGETFKQEFTIRQYGTFMYHSHHDTMTQEGMGLTGLFVVHPRRQLYAAADLGPPADRDFAMLLHEWRVEVGAARPNPFNDQFNLFTINGRVMPDTEHLIARLGQRVRFRWGNLSAMDHHPMHLHGHEFAVVMEDSYPVPADQQTLKATSLIPVGRTQTWEFLTLDEGDWVFHCHMTHHTMNQMFFGFSNTIGVGNKDLDPEVQKVLPDYMTMATAGMNDRTGKPKFPIPPNSIPMKKGEGQYNQIGLGGMASVLKVRAEISDEMLARNADPGWYRHPLDRLALPAKPEELRRDGIDV
jgi:FtsP/CotA-like multicopper oxidase with cupredoxin domain